MGLQSNQSVWPKGRSRSRNLKSTINYFQKPNNFLLQICLAFCFDMWGRKGSVGLWCRVWWPGGDPLFSTAQCAIADGIGAKWMLNVSRMQCLLHSSDGECRWHSRPTQGVISVPWWAPPCKPSRFIFWDNDTEDWKHIPKLSNFCVFVIVEPTDQQSRFFASPLTSSRFVGNEWRKPISCRPHNSLSLLSARIRWAGPQLLPFNRSQPGTALNRMKSILWYKLVSLIHTHAPSCDNDRIGGVNNNIWEWARCVGSSVVWRLEMGHHSPLTTLRKNLRRLALVYLPGYSNTNNV